MGLVVVAEVNVIMAWGLIQIGLSRACESLADQTMLSRYVAWVRSGLAVPAMVIPCHFTHLPITLDMPPRHGPISTGIDVRGGRDILPVMLN